MGTRNLTCVKIDGDYKVAQYGQWDGYPSGAGTDILRLLQNLVLLDKLDELRSRVRKLRWATEEEVQAAWKKCGADDSGSVSLDVSKHFSEKFPEWHRDTGCEILQLILGMPIVKKRWDGNTWQTIETFGNPVSAVQNSLEFAADGLFCEWAYVIDLDSNELRVFEGFQKGECMGEFADMTPANETYKPVSLVATFALDALPTEEEFLNQLEPEEPSHAT